MVSAATFVAEPAVQRRLSRRILSEAGREDVAEDAFLDERRIDAGARDGFAHGNRAELGGLEAFQLAEKFSRRQASGADDDGRSHVTSPRDA